MTRTPLTESETQQVIKLFYRTELREWEDVIDNRVLTISKELGLNRDLVDDCIDESIKKLKKGL